MFTNILPKLSLITLFPPETAGYQVGRFVLPTTPYCKMLRGLGKLLVDLLQVVVTLTNTPQRPPLTNGVVDGTMVFWGVVGSIPTIQNNKAFRFPHVGH